MCKVRHRQRCCWYAVSQNSNTPFKLCFRRAQPSAGNGNELKDTIMLYVSSCSYAARISIAGCNEQEKAKQVMHEMRWETSHAMNFSVRYKGTCR